MDYLGVTIDYSIPRKDLFTMFDYLENVIVETAEDLKNSHSYYPGKKQLFKVNYDSPSLPLKNAVLFHCHVARLLSASKRVRPDIQVCVAFLCTRVELPNGARLLEIYKSNYLPERNCSSTIGYRERW